MDSAEDSARKSEWPYRGDFVIGTVESVRDYGAYVRLDEYEKRGLLHVSEISTRWIRNIRDFVREGQKIVLKVLRVNTDKEQIDLSLRRVTKRQRIEKIKSWKEERKAETLLRNVAEKTGLSIEEVYAKAGELMESQYGLYEAFEKLAKEGPSFLDEIGIPNELSTALTEVAKERIRVPSVRVKGVVELQCPERNGVEVLRQAFLEAQRADKDRGSELHSYVIGAPKYRVEAVAENYKQAETALEEFAERVISSVVKAGGSGSFRREK